MKPLFLIIFSGIFFYEITSFSVSVPPLRSVCRTMIPGHDKYKPQQGNSPFFVWTDVESAKGDEIVEVTLSASGNHTFKGYYLQAKDSKNSPIGSFNSNTFAKTHSCGGIRGNAAHHANSDVKKKVKVSWNAPNNYVGDVTFTATFVENYVTFWTKNKAKVVKILA